MSNKDNKKTKEIQSAVLSSGQADRTTIRPPMVIEVLWDGNERIVADTPLHCRIPMAGNREVHVAGKYPSPLDLFVASLGGCPSHEILTVMMERKRTITYLAVKVEGTRRDSLPTIFEKIHVSFSIAGDIDDRITREVIDDVMTLRCPVAVSFAKATTLTWEYHIVPVVPLYPDRQQVTGTDGNKRDFDREAVTWDENPGKVKLAHDLAGAITGIIDPGQKPDVLDFGAGTGLVALALQPHARTITAVDSSQGMLDSLDAKVKEHKFTNVRTRLLNLDQGDRLVDLDYGDRLDGQFDLVVSSMTLHHIRDVGTLLEQMAGVLRPSGRIIIADLDPEEGKFHDTPAGIFHEGFERHAMRQYLETAGFTDVKDRTAAVIQKPGPSGKMQAFSVFLMTGKKRDGQA